MNKTTSFVKTYNFRELMKGTISKMDYLAHNIHPYTAKLIPQIPHYFLERLTQKGDVVLDCFCGSGTTLLEARHLDRCAIGIDINPLATLISEVKTTPLNMVELSAAARLVKDQLKKGSERITVTFPNIDYWFCKEAQSELCKIKSVIENLKGRSNESIYRFLLVCFSSIIRKSSYADPRIAKTYRSKRIIEKIENGWTPTPIKYFERALDKNFERIKTISDLPNISNNSYVEVFQGDARETSTILNQNKIDEVDFIITSPPYINAQDYFRSYKLEIWWLGLSTPQEVSQFNRESIGTERISGIDHNSIPKCSNAILEKIFQTIWEKGENRKKREKVYKKKVYIIHNYFEDMQYVFQEFCKVLRTGGYFCLVSGNNTICGVQIPTHNILTQIAKNNGFELIETGRDEIKNRTLPPNRNHEGGIIKEEWITIFRKV